MLDLDPGATLCQWWEEHIEIRLFPTISVLKGLKTLYIESLSGHGILMYATDLTGCVHLTHVAVQGVSLVGELALPAGCLLHAQSHGGKLGIREVTDDIAQLVTGLTVRENPRKQ